MKKSVESNGGFYIGRYEAGRLDEEVVVRKNMPVYNNIAWSEKDDMTDTNGGAKQLAEEFSNKNKYSNIDTTLCYGVQWDATMQFIDKNYINHTCTETSYVRNSSKNGNYTGILANTGADESYAIKNVYDMAGNVYEWTMEAYGNNSRIYRGGGYGSDGNIFPSSLRLNCLPSYSFENVGFRIVLIL